MNKTETIRKAIADNPTLGNKALAEHLETTQPDQKPWSPGTVAVVRSSMKKTANVPPKKKTVPENPPVKEDDAFLVKLAGLKKLIGKEGVLKLLDAA